MFFTFLAQSAAPPVDPSFIGNLVLALGALAAGGLGGGFLVRKSLKVDANVKNSDVYALKEDVSRDLGRIDKDIDDIRQLMRESETAAHRRMDKMTVVLSQVDGKMDLLLGKFNITSKP